MGLQQQDPTAGRIGRWEARFRIGRKKYVAECRGDYMETVEELWRARRSKYRFITPLDEFAEAMVERLVYRTFEEAGLFRFYPTNDARDTLDTVKMERWRLGQDAHIREMQDELDSING